ncbi:MAG: Lrp/AsnC family transcriptional regulator [Microlunatus sp.]|nr:Lrp/AsnC family transcriptional regulator [Microlunatus sp.]
MTTASHVSLDRLDRDLIDLFAAEPRIGVLGASRRLRVARGTVQARLDRLERAGVVTGWGPDVSPRALGYGVTAFVTIKIAQDSGRESLIGYLVAIPELLECWTITGSRDLWCRILARDNDDLQRVIDTIVQEEQVVRSSTRMGLSEAIPYRTGPLVATEPPPVAARRW